MLNTVVFDQPSSMDIDHGLTPVVLLHGFTQNTRCWGAFADALRRTMPGRMLVAVDAPGHGLSGHDNADLVSTADLVVEALESVGVERAVWLGYSMGGRAGLHGSIFRPNRVAGLVLIGASPGLADLEERRIRREADERLAERLLVDGLEVFLDRWLAGPLFTGLAPDAAAKPARLTNRPEGLATSLRACGTGVQENLWPRLVQVRCPALLIHGSDDEKFSRIARSMAAEMRRRDSAGAMTPVEVSSVDGSHAVHLEQPEIVAERVAEFVSRC